MDSVQIRETATGGGRADGGTGPLETHLRAATSEVLQYVGRLNRQYGEN